ncbi:MAG: threonine/serine dehydratase [Candidatus Eiseniibacteriota bacterium]|jgi:threonine dehydratase
MTESIDAILPDRAALGRVRSVLGEGVHRTPVVSSRLLSAAAGCELFLKCEQLQRSGSFKIRGALHFLTRLGAEARARGVVTGSSGNHGQAVALAAREVGTRATIVAPEDIAAVKAAAIRGYGATLERCGRSSAERLGRAAELAAPPGGPVMVPPYDHPWIVQGQATLGLELVEQASDLDAVAVPVGGGGLISGCALAVKLLAPRVRVVGVETEAADDAGRSFRAGERLAIELPDTIAEGIRNLQVGELNWEVIRRRVDDMVTVTDDAVLEAMALLLTRAKVVAEPTGAVAVAAVLAGKVPGRRVAAVVSGGNLDPALLARLPTTI